MINRREIPLLKPVKGLDVVQPETLELGNGIPVVAIKAGTEPICRIDLVFEAGSRYQDQLFVASLTSQMLPEGTRSRTGGQIAEEFEFYGSYFNAAADRDHAELTIHTLDKYLEPVLEVVREVLAEPSFPQVELNIIKQNRIQSMQVDDQRVETLSRKAFNRAVFGIRHPYGKVAEYTDVGPVKRRQLIDFYRKYYTASNCRILITGRDPELYFRQVNKILGRDWSVESAGSAPHLVPLPAIEPALPERISIEKNEALQASIRIGKPLFTRTHPDFQGLTIVNTILGGYFGSRLMKNIREEKGLTYGISSHLVPLKDHGYFVIGSTLEAGSAELAISECRKEMIRLREEKVSGTELDLVRNYLTGQIQRSVDGPLQLAEQFRALWLHNLDFRHLQEFIQLINDISPGQLRDLAATHLNPAEMIEVLAGPRGN